MTEWDKMVAGLSYDAGDPQLTALRLRAARLCHQLNLLSPDQDSERQALLRELLGHTGEHFTITPGFQCDYGANITLGERFYANYNCVILDCAPVTFGNDVLVGPNCGFYTAGHPLDASIRRNGVEFAHPITVGSDVWFGGGVSVLPGVTIGDGAVIGAGSVVTRDVPAYTLAAGNPCRILRPLSN